MTDHATKPSERITEIARESMRGRSVVQPADILRAVLYYLDEQAASANPAASPSGEVAAPSPVEPIPEPSARTINWAREDMTKRQPGCECHLEEGDSPCPLHGLDEQAPQAEATPPEPQPDRCYYCKKGFPLLKSGMHAPTQALGMIPNTPCEAIAPSDDIIRAAEGVTLEPGEYCDCTPGLASYHALTVTQSCESEREPSFGIWCWYVGRFKVTAVRRVAPESAAKPPAELYVPSEGETVKVLEIAGFESPESTFVEVGREYVTIAAFPGNGRHEGFVCLHHDERGGTWCRVVPAPLTEPEPPKRVVIESPFGRNVDGSKCTPAEYARNIRYLDRCIRDSLSRGEAPYASHGFFPAPGRLDDTILEQREQGIAAGLAWGDAAHLRAAYIDHGETEGMTRAIGHSERNGVTVERRSIGAERFAEPEPVPESDGETSAPWNARGECPHGKPRCGHCVDAGKALTKERDELRSKVSGLEKELAAAHASASRWTGESVMLGAKSMQLCGIIDQFRSTLTATEAKLARNDKRFAEALSGEAETVRAHRERLTELEQPLARVAEQAHDRDGDTLELRSERLGMCAALSWDHMEESFSSDPLKKRSTLKWAKLAEQVTKLEGQVATRDAELARVRGELAKAKCRCAIPNFNRFDMCTDCNKPKATETPAVAAPAESALTKHMGTCRCGRPLDGFDCNGAQCVADSAPAVVQREIVVGSTWEAREQDWQARVTHLAGSLVSYLWTERKILGGGDMDRILFLKTFAHVCDPPAPPAAEPPQPASVCLGCGKPFTSPDHDPRCSSCVESGTGPEPMKPPAPPTAIPRGTTLEVGRPYRITQVSHRDNNPHHKPGDLVRAVSDDSPAGGEFIINTCTHSGDWFAYGALGGTYVTGLELVPGPVKEQA